MIFSDKKTEGLLSYINSMSAKGYHIEKAEGSSCYFYPDDEVRYFYAVSLRTDGGIYEALDSAWSYVFTFKGVRFYRKQLPSEITSQKKNFSREKDPKKAESEWLAAKRDEGERVTAFCSGEYIFDSEIEYGIDRESGKYRTVEITSELDDSENDKLIELTRHGWRFLFSSDNGKKFYFFRAESDAPGSRGTIAEVATAFLGATLSLILMFGSLGITVLTVIRSMFFDGSFDPRRILTDGIRPEWAFALSMLGTFAFGISYLVFSAMLAKRAEARRKRGERLHRMAEAQKSPLPQDLPEPSDDGQINDEALDISDDPSSENAAPSVGAFSVKGDEYGSDIGITGFIFNLIAIIVSCAVFAACVIFCYGYFTSGTENARWILIPAFLGICFFPFIVYGAAEKCGAFISSRRKKRP